jgi:hypothetical protein
MLNENNNNKVEATAEAAANSHANVNVNAFLTKLSVLSNVRKRIEEQAKEIGKAADQINKYIEMLRGTGLTYTADSMARNTAEIKRCQEIISKIVKEVKE